MQIPHQKPEDLLPKRCRTQWRKRCRNDFPGGPHRPAGAEDEARCNPSRLPTGIKRDIQQPFTHSFTTCNPSPNSAHVRLSTRNTTFSSSSGDSPPHHPCLTDATAQYEQSASHYESAYGVHTLILLILLLMQLYLLHGLLLLRFLLGGTPLDGCPPPRRFLGLRYHKGLRYHGNGRVRGNAAVPVAPQDADVAVLSVELGPTVTHLWVGGAGGSTLKNSEAHP